MLERILLAIEESEHARKAIPAAVELARAGGGTVHVLHVRELVFAHATVVGDSRQEAQQLVDAVVEELKQAGVVAENSVRTSTAGPARGILEHARGPRRHHDRARVPGPGGPRRPTARQRRAQDHPAGQLPRPGGPRRAEPRRAAPRRAQGADQVPGLSRRECCLIGFTTYRGTTATAADDWEGPAERKRVRPALGDSVEELFHRGPPGQAAAGARSRRSACSRRSTPCTGIPAPRASCSSSRGNRNRRAPASAAAIAFCSTPPTSRPSWTTG